MAQYTRDGLTVEIDMQRPEAPIRYQIDGWGWEDSPYQTASMPIEQRDEETAWALVSDWLDQQ